MRRSTAALVLLVVASNHPAARAQTTTQRELAPGVRLIQEIVPADRPGGPLVVTVLQVDAKKRGVSVTAALGQDRVWGNDPTFGREAVSTLAARRGAVAGINAGFFPFAGNPIGLHVEDGGEIVTEPVDRAAIVLFRDGSVRFDTFAFAGTVRAEGAAPLTVHGLNRRPGKGNELLVFTPRFAETTLKSPGRFEVILTGVRAPIRPNRDIVGTVEARGASPDGQIPIAPGSIVLSAGGASGDALRALAKPGSRLTLRLEVTPSSTSTPIIDWRAVRGAVTGGPRLLTSGAVTITAARENFGREFVTTRHPRTAVGRTKDGKILLVAVDGRQKTLSRGASLPELAAILLKFGAVDAINLDGGSSTALIARDRIVNSPSEGIERPIADALLVFAPEAKKAGVVPPLTLSATPAESASISVGESIRLTLEDGKRRPLTTHPRALWGTTGGVGFVDQSGFFRALRPGNGRVHATLGDNTISLPVTVVGPPPEPPVAPARTGQ